MSNTNLDPAVEFVDPDPNAAVTPDPEPAPSPKEPPAVTAEEVADLKSKYAATLGELQRLGSKAAVFDKLQEVFGGKPEDPREKFINDELKRRLGGELEDVAAIKRALPAVLAMLDATIEEKLAEKVDSAQEHLKGLADKLGLDTDDAKTMGYLEETITREIKTNKELLGLWQKGKVKSAVTKAFEEVQAKLFAPVRAGAKRSAVTSITTAPKASPKGSAGTPAPAAPKKVDLSDTSRDGIKKVHDAAFDRLQELLDRE